MRIGVWINVAGILAGGLLGYMCGSHLKQRMQDSLTAVCGISVIFIGISGAMEGMLSVAGNSISSGNAMLVTVSLEKSFICGSAGEKSSFAAFPETSGSFAGYFFQRR